MRWSRFADWVEFTAGLDPEVIELVNPAVCILAWRILSVRAVVRRASDPRPAGSKIYHPVALDTTDIDEAPPECIDYRSGSPAFEELCETTLLTCLRCDASVGVRPGGRSPGYAGQPVLRRQEGAVRPGMLEAPGLPRSPTTIWSPGSSLLPTPS